MSMSVGELFVNLGIKGSEKTVGAVSSVTKGLSEARSMSIEAKAGILGAVYAVERMMAASDKTGMALRQFSELTGLSAETLQRWQYAARQGGESFDDFTGSVKAVQGAVTNMLLNKSAPEYIGLISRYVKDFDPTKLRDTFYVMSKLTEAAKAMPKDVGQPILKAWGVSDSFISAARMGVFNEKNFKSAPVYSEAQQAALAKADAAWANLGQKVEMSFGKFNAKHAKEFTHDIGLLADAAIKLGEALAKISEKYKVIEGVGHGIEGIANSVRFLTGDFPSDKETNAAYSKQEKDRGPTWVDKIDDLLLRLSHPISDAWKGISGGTPDIAYSLQDPNSIPVPAEPRMRGHHSGKGNTYNIKNQTTFQGHNEAPRKTANELHKAIGDVVKQNPAKVQDS